VLRTVRFAAGGLAQEHGWFYHFVDPATGRRDGGSEVSTIDTALFLQGALFAREYFRDAEITACALAIYERIDWHWAENGGLSLSMGWRPEDGFIPALGRLLRADGPVSARPRRAARSAAAGGMGRVATRPARDG